MGAMLTVGWSILFGYAAQTAAMLHMVSQQFVKSSFTLPVSPLPLCSCPAGVGQHQRGSGVRSV